MPPPSAAALSQADRMIRQSVDQAGKLISLRGARGKRAARELLELLARADANLSRRLRREAALQGGMTARFTGASAEAYRAQIRLVTAYVSNRLLGMTEAQASYAIRQSYVQTVELLEGLEKRFTGVVTPLRIRQQSVLSRLQRGTKSSLLAQHATSVDRYGDGMIQEFEKRIRVGLLEGRTNRQMAIELAGSHGGPKGIVSMAAREIKPGLVERLSEEDIPEGLFVRYRSWADRIVRTETAHAYQQAKLDGYQEVRNADFPDLQKKILAVLDNRTAPDSIAVHGQVRGINDYFMDGAGRQYLRPPGRPNDRETIIPWRPHWPETPHSRALSSAERQSAIRQSIPGKASNRTKTAEQRATERKRLSAHARQEVRARKARVT
jgi:hypothetical protein